MSTYTLPNGNIIPTARIPEIAHFSTVASEIKGNDKLVFYKTDQDKTVHMLLSELRTYAMTGGSSTITPVIQDGKDFIYTVPVWEAGGQIASIPILAGKAFSLEREGYPLVHQEYDSSGNAKYDAADIDFEILSSGGFKLVKVVDGQTDTLVEKVRYKVSPYSSGVSSTPTSTTTGSSFIQGIVKVAANLLFDPLNHLHKVLSMETGSTKRTITLCDVTNVNLPKNQVIIIASVINSTVENKVTTTAGQFIYLNGQSFTSIYVRPGEIVMLLRDDTGWYVINEFGRVYDELGKIQSAYKIGRNELLLDGSELLRADYPRLWEVVQTMGSALIEETLWQTAAVYRQGNSYFTSPPSGTYDTIMRPYRGCFSSGDGTTTFRVPDLMNMFLRSVKTTAGTDNERYYNKAGGYQRGMNEEHDHGVNTTGDQNGVDPGRSLQRADNPGDNFGKGSGIGYVSTEGGIESRPENIGVLYTIKC